MRERLVVRNRGARDLRLRLSVEVASDGADLSLVKAGATPPRPAPASAESTGTAYWADERHHTRVSVDGADVTALDDGSTRFAWELLVLAGREASSELRVEVARTAPTAFDVAPGAALVDWSDVAVQCPDARLAHTLDRSLEDLSGLLLRDPDDPRDVFAGAGTPWYLTLFGRDALWTARLMLPFGTALAGGTLRTLARRQGEVHDTERAEEPGKILHEVRRAGFSDPGSHLHLPPLYFGTVDATPLWVCLLHDAWRWGLPEHEVRSLVPAMDRALGWMREAVASSGDGLIRYVDHTGHGLSNQGWKDSGDAMRHRDGHIAVAPIALVETQAYAVEAALGAAEMLEALEGRPADDLRAWAAALSQRVRERFWVTDAHGPYLAMALDADGDPVDGVGSNMGHVLGSGMLQETEEQLVVERLVGDDLLSPFGLRTLSRSNPAFNPTGYHTGSVWTHDSAIAAWCLSRSGAGARAVPLLRALVEVAGVFDYRLPELYAGDSDLGRPIPYPASCRPQAWAAASAAVLVTACLGLQVDVPRRRLTVRPLAPAPFGAMRASGLRLADDPLTITTDSAGSLAELDGPPWAGSPTG